MSLSASEATKVRKLLAKIQSGTFDDNDVDLLFMKLREHSSGHPVFREIADFVAHNKCRDQGLTNASLYASYLCFRYLSEYTLRQKRLKVDGQIPLWVKKLIVLQIDSCDEDDLYLQFKLSRDTAKHKIRSLYRDIPHTQMCSYIKHSMDQETFDLLRHLLGFIKLQPAYTQEQIIDQLVTVLAKHDLLEDNSAEELRGQADKIMVAVLCLLHRSKFDLKNGAQGSCHISCEQSQGYNPQFMPPNFGRLSLFGLVPSTHVEKHFDVTFMVCTTTLDALQWTSESLYSEKASIVTLDFDCDLRLDNTFKLARL